MMRFSQVSLSVDVKAFVKMSSVNFQFFCNTFQVEGAEWTKAIFPISARANGTESNK